MGAFLRFIVVLVVLAVIVAGGAWFWAGRSTGPTIAIRQPGQFVGQNSSFEMVVEAPEGKFSSVDVIVEQGGKSFPVFTLDQPQGNIKQESAERIYVMRPIGKKALPDLQAGPARIVVNASRPVFFGLRNVSSSTTHDVTVRLDPPQVTVLSTFHYINHGGSEFVVYRAAPADVESGVRVGNIEYRGYPASGIGLTSDPALRVAFFALLFDQDLNTDFQVFARDPAGNEALAALDHQVFAKPYSKSRIEIDDRFIGRVVPAIASNSPQEQIPTDDLLSGFLKINGDLRRKNNQYITDLAKKSAPEMLFKGAFQQLGNSQVEARFADTRTYVYKGKEVDRQVHLGFDLAVTANVPIVAAERGVIVHASDLGIYGNCVVIDHGLGVQSLYGHLSSIGVKVGDKIEKGAEVGRSGMTGLAGGDHLHFTMLVGGQQVTPVDWWSTQWFEDRVHRKIVAAGGV
ncbi:MAG TPA: M23 family metallopeptidase [Vicinamibacterales bacterium]|jgi:murein DD-endopeptidase MepM/ murein hydrolase activator NlpD|nr:M23 family metallopeptidase [Vicinamibacterales bacterium]